MSSSATPRRLGSEEYPHPTRSREPIRRGGELKKLKPSEKVVAFGCLARLVLAPNDTGADIPCQANNLKIRIP